MQRSELHVNPHPGSTSRLFMSTATGYAEFIESIILRLDDYNYGYGLFETVLCCQLNEFGIEAGSKHK